jgi:hypothetical protein
MISYVKEQPKMKGYVNLEQTTVDGHDITKLPAWAQRHISVLEQHTKYMMFIATRETHINKLVEAKLHMKDMNLASGDMLAVDIRDMAMQIATDLGLELA